MSTTATTTTTARTAESVRVWRDLMVVHAGILAELADALERDHQLSVSEFDVLVTLDPTEPMRHGDLADRVILSRTALTRLVDRLVGCGLVERLPDPRDQRAVRIGLTDAGRATRRAAARTNARVVRARFGVLDPTDLATLDALLRRLRGIPNEPHNEGDRP